MSLNNVDPESAHAMNVAPVAKSFEERVTPITVERICRACHRVHGKDGWNPRHIAQYDESCERCDCIDQERESKLTGKHCLSCKRPLGINDVEQRVRSDYREHLERDAPTYPTVEAKRRQNWIDHGRDLERDAIIAFTEGYASTCPDDAHTFDYFVQCLRDGEHRL